MRYVLASANPGKVREMRDIMSELGVEVVSRDELGVNIDVEETGDTFFENARLKAVALCAETGLPSIADDSGLVVEALGGEPGVYSSTYGGESLSNDERNEYLLEKMRYMEHRSAKYVCTIVCAYPDGSIITSNGECRGEIARFPSGKSGFGYDPVFYIQELGKTMAELTPEEKNAISHRGAALRAFAEI